MDFDIGTLVYILLTLIFLIVGALGKKKKKNPQVFESYDEEEQEQDTAVNNFEERFNNLFNDDRTRVESEEEFQKQTEAKSSEKPEHLLDTPHDKLDEIPEDYNKIHKDKDEKELYKLEDHIEEISRKTKLKIPSARRSEKPSFVQKALRGFDPRKAYLYSEIFKPKYF